MLSGYTATLRRRPERASPSYQSHPLALLTTTMASLRIIFMGTADLSCASLQSLIAAADCQVVAVVTQPDRPKGRNLKLQPSPVKALALRANLPVLQPERARDETFIQALRELAPDFVAVVAYGQILPKSILDLPRFGCFNVHTSLLPKYRGAAPIQRAVLGGESETGVTIMKMDVGLDTGDILIQEKTPIAAEDDSQTLHDRLAQMGAQALLAAIREHVAGNLSPRPQPTEGVSYAHKIKKEDGRIDWSRPAHAIWNQVRGLVPWPGAFTYLQGSPQAFLIKIWQAEVAAQSGSPGEILQADKGGVVIGCGRDALRVSMLQREGGRRLPARDFLAGHPLLPGQMLT
jgi:methionyl-tRNA formyltransferase